MSEPENVVESLDAKLQATLDPILPAWNAVKVKDRNETAVPQDSYFVFNYTTHGIGYADDEPTGELAIIQVHLYAPLATNLTSLRRQTKSAIHEAGFTWPEVLDLSDETARHLVFEFQDVEGVDLDGNL